MIKKSYNGWSAETRSVRGAWFYSKRPIKYTNSCKLCGNTKGITFHAEEYGSTIEDYLLSCHELCPYCHGMMHMRFKYKKRFMRFRDRVGAGAKGFVEFNSLNEFYQALKPLKDLASYDGPGVSGIDWLDAIEVVPYNGIQKIPLVLTKQGEFKPDLAILSKHKPIEGLRYDAKTGLVYPYMYDGVYIRSK